MNDWYWLVFGVLVALRLLERRGSVPPVAGDVALAAAVYVLVARVLSGTWALLSAVLTLGLVLLMRRYWHQNPFARESSEQASGRNIGDNP
jgi:membrane protein implicated in regulation of membrane protease activity